MTNKIEIDISSILKVIKYGILSIYASLIGRLFTLFLFVKSFDKLSREGQKMKMEIIKNNASFNLIL